MFPDEAACEISVLRPLSRRLCVSEVRSTMRPHDTKAVRQPDQSDERHRQDEAAASNVVLGRHLSYTRPVSAPFSFSALADPRYETARARVDPERETLHGTVEIDEMYYSNKAGYRAIIIGAIEVKERAWVDPEVPGQYKGGKIAEKRPFIAGRLRMHVIPDETAVSFLGFTTKNVDRGAVIHTDGDPSYNGLGSLGYDHRPKVQGKGKMAVYGLDHIHRAFSNFRTWLSGTHHDAVLPKHVQAYCNEFVYRHNRRGSPWTAFNRRLGLLEGGHPARVRDSTRPVARVDGSIRTRGMTS